MGPFTVAGMGMTATNFVDADAAVGRINYYKIASVGNCGTGPTSTAVSAVLPSPSLGFAANGSEGTFTVNWPAWGSYWTLWTTTNLTPPVTWVQATNSINSSNGQKHCYGPDCAGRRIIPADEPVRSYEPGGISICASIYLAGEQSAIAPWRLFARASSRGAWSHFMPAMTVFRGELRISPCFHDAQTSRFRCHLSAVRVDHRGIKKNTP